MIWLGLVNLALLGLIWYLLSLLRSERETHRQEVEHWTAFAMSAAGRPDLHLTPTQPAKRSLMRVPNYYDAKPRMVINAPDATRK